MKDNVLLRFSVGRTNRFIVMLIVVLPLYYQFRLLPLQASLWH